MESDVLDETMNTAEKTDGEVDNLIKQVQDRMNTFNDAQLDYANKAIKSRDIARLKDCLK